MPDEDKKWKPENVIKGVSYLARTETIDRIVPLDDFDLETAAALREHLRVPGFGETRTRYFRDKLAMRMKAQEAGINVPEFVHVLNYQKLKDYMARVPAPWLLKPRDEASATGIKKINSPEELWPEIEKLGDRQSYYLMERFVPGDIYHLDSIVSEQEVVFAAANKYGNPPMDVAHRGGIFTTMTLGRDSEDERELEELNRRVLAAMGHVRGVSHTEFIKAREDGRFYFLETAARVGGANIVELVEAATGVNLWREWAGIEILWDRGGYTPPPPREDYAGLIISLARQERPDTSDYGDAEIVWRMNKHHHVGLIVASSDPRRVEQLLAEYTERFYRDFHASRPMTDRPTS
ncbi:MAG TPA: ATP-grasp domain-containing protein, partial [Pyrinomonadaceae bacterium]|jgi:carbamoylphosphate synthase large subunit